tara:strand:- start:12101 stop:13024 length:924 start_codon:yes stop_codon:yes gene_type:complete
MELPSVSISAQPLRLTELSEKPKINLREGLASYKHQVTQEVTRPLNTYAVRQKEQPLIANRLEWFESLPQSYSVQEENGSVAFSVNEPTGKANFNALFSQDIEAICEFKQGLFRNQRFEIFSSRKFSKIEERKLGIEFEMLKPAMVLDLEAMKSLPKNKDCTTKQVTSEKEFATWLQTAYDGFGSSNQAFHTDITPLFTKGITPGDTHARFFLGHNKEGVPTTSLMLLLGKETTGLYYVSTLEEFRRQGMAATVLQDALQFAKDAGSKSVILDSESDGATNLYKRLGFETKRSYYLYESPMCTVSGA